jgi:hypothetical protein
VVRSWSLRRHHGDNILKDQEGCERLRALPLKAMECGFVWWRMDC